MALNEPGPGTAAGAAELIASVREGARLTPERALALLRTVDILDLGRLADERRQQRHPERLVTFIPGGEIELSNICAEACRFCARRREPGHADAFQLSSEDVLRRADALVAAGGRQLRLRMGVQTGPDLERVAQLLRAIKAEHDLHLQALTPTAIRRLATAAGATIADTLGALRDAGLDALSFGGAEILSDRVRRRISPGRDSVAEWFETTILAHNQGFRGSTSLMFGHLETEEEIVEHLELVRALQDSTGGFTAFIPIGFRPRGTDLDGESVTALEHLRILALSRLYLDNIANIQLYYPGARDTIDQPSLRFGANDCGVIRPGTNESETARLIVDAGFAPAVRNADYRIVEVL